MIKSTDKTGTFMGAPYDFTRPTLKRFRQRMWDKDGPMIVPHVFGWGWTLNLRHPGSLVLVGTLIVVASVAIVGQ